MSELTAKDYNFMDSCKRKVFDGCNQYDLMMKLKPHHSKAIKIGADDYIIKYVEDKGFGMAGGYDRVCLLPIEWVESQQFDTTAKVV